MTCSSTKFVSYDGAVVYPGENINLQHNSRWVVLLKGCDRFDLFKLRYNLCTGKFDIFRVSRRQIRDMGVTLVIKDVLTERKLTIDPSCKDVWRLSPLGAHAQKSFKRDGCGCKDYCVVAIPRAALENAPYDCSPCGTGCGSGSGYHGHGSGCGSGCGC